MKKAIALTLAAVLFLSVLIFFPRSTYAEADRCYNDWSRCRARALDSGEPWYKVTLFLTVCDGALGWCLIRSSS